MTGASGPFHRSAATHTSVPGGIAAGGGGGGSASPASHPVSARRRPAATPAKARWAVRSRRPAGPRAVTTGATRSVTRSSPARRLGRARGSGVSGESRPARRRHSSTVSTGPKARPISSGGPPCKRSRAGVGRESGGDQVVCGASLLLITLRSTGRSTGEVSARDSKEPGLFAKIVHGSGWGGSSGFRHIPSAPLVFARGVPDEATGQEAGCHRGPFRAGR